MGFRVLQRGLGEDPLVKYLFRTNVFRILGRISYSQYLLQARSDTTVPTTRTMLCPEDPVSSFLAFYLIPDRHGPWGHNPIPEKQLGQQRSSNLVKNSRL